MNKTYDAVIIGAGPAGIFTALELMKHDETKKVLLMDSGRAIAERKCPARITGKCVGCNPCAIMSGWAGAGAFSDGKLSLSHEVGGNITKYIPEAEAQALIDYADSVYVGFGAPDACTARATRRWLKSLMRQAATTSILCAAPCGTWARNIPQLCLKTCISG